MTTRGQPTGAGCLRRDRPRGSPTERGMLLLDRNWRCDEGESTWCCATVTCWWPVRSRPGAVTRAGRRTGGRPGPAGAAAPAGLEVGRGARRPARGGARRPGGGAPATTRRLRSSTTSRGWPDAVRNHAHGGANGAVGHLVDVQADVSSGQVATVLVGRPDSALSESRDRCRMAILNSRYDWPATRRTTILLSPADLPKRGTHYDLAIAVAVLGAIGVVPSGSLPGGLFIGELTLAGGLRSVPGCSRW